MQLPHTVGQAVFAWFKAANVGTSAYPFLTMGNARPAARPRQPGADRHLRRGRSSRAAGSARWPVGAAGRLVAGRHHHEGRARRTTARYRLTGNKMWISGGDHELTENIVHLVLAKIPGGPPGVKGISLFIVPKFLVNDDGSLGERNDVVLAGLNHKMGYRGTTNTLLNFGEGVHTPGRAGRRGRLPGRRAAPRPDLHVPHDERGADRRRHGRDGARLHRLPARARLRPHPHAGPAGGRQGPGSAAGADHRARRRAPDAAGREVLRRGRSRARPVLRAAGRRGADRRDRGRPRPGRTCCSTCSPRSRRPGRRSGARSPTTSPSRCTAATATPATTRSSSSTATTGSTRSTRAPTGIQALDLLGRKVVMQGGAGLALLGETIAATTARAAGTEWAGVRRRPRRRRRPAGRGHRDAVGRGRPRGHAGQRARLPGGGRPPRRRLAVAGAGAGRRATPAATSTRASGRRPGTSGAGSCRGCTTASTCWSRWTGRCWTPRRPGSDAHDPERTEPRSLRAERRGVGRASVGSGGERAHRLGDGVARTGGLLGPRSRS